MMEKAQGLFERALPACSHGSDGCIQPLKRRRAANEDTDERQRCLSMVPKVKTPLTHGVWLAGEERLMKYSDLR
jgi:hypothetical protein